MKKLFSHFIILGCCFQALSQPTNLIWKNAQVFDGLELQEMWVVIISGDKISYAGTESDAPEIEGREFDLSEHTILPGLIEGHSHL